MEGEPFLEGLDSLEKAIASFFHVCFVANMQYPQVELVVEVVGSGASKTMVKEVAELIYLLTIEMVY